MALTDENNGIPATMLVSPTGYAGGNNGGFGFGGDWAWILLLLLIGGNGWGMGGFGGGMWPMMMGGMGGFGLGYDFPWLLNGQQGINNNVSNGFRDAQIHDSITSVRDGVSNLATQLCGCCGDMQMGMANGFAGVQQSLCNGFAGTTAAVTGAQNAITQQLNQNQISSLERSFAAQTANTAALNAIQAQQAQCCCDNRAGLADLKYTVATENCADRAALSEGLRDILAATQAQTQTILTQLCNDKIEQKNDTIAQLRSELLYARGQASQDVQTARILAGQTAETDAVYNRLSQCPVGTVPVFGNQPIFTCPTNIGNNCGCGCGCNG
jgi:hypothetical protein